jgi:iron-sulfur cluster repair protein YtfE (RIC family)
MLTTISTGAPRLHEGDLVDLLLDCHRRIRRFVAIARHLADADAVTDDEAREAAESIRRYFTVALPLHVADEEQSIVPRLRGRNLTLDGALREMEKEHVEHLAALAQLAALCSRVAAAPAARPTLRAELGQVVGGLDQAFAGHLAREEAVIFPAIRQLLDGEKQAAILGELRARRVRQPA